VGRETSNRILGLDLAVVLGEDRSRLVNTCPAHRKAIVEAVTRAVGRG
jgi:hypothetical protein